MSTLTAIPAAAYLEQAATAIEKSEYYNGVII